jgi:hypothetical protein
MTFVEFLIVVVLGIAYFGWFLPLIGSSGRRGNNSWSGCVDNDEPDDTGRAR